MPLNEGRSGEERVISSRGPRSVSIHSNINIKYQNNLQTIFVFNEYMLCVQVSLIQPIYSV